MSHLTLQRKTSKHLVNTVNKLIRGSDSDSIYSTMLYVAIIIMTVIPQNVPAIILYKQINIVQFQIYFFLQIHNCLVTTEKY